MASPIFRTNPTFIQRRGKRGKFELIVALANGSSLYNLTRDNESTTQYPWTLTKIFAQNIGVVVGLSVIEGLFNSPGNLELIVNKSGQLVHFSNDPKGNWSGQNPVTDAPVLGGVPAFYQTKPVKFGAREDLEVVAPSATGGLVWLWRDNNGSGPSYSWSKPSFFGQALGPVTSATVIPNPEFLELIVTVGAKLHYFYRAVNRAAVWQGPSTVRPEYNIAPNAALITSTLGISKNDFVLIVPALIGGGLLSFERNNKLSPAPWSIGTAFGTNLGQVTGIAFRHGNLGASENNLEGIVIARGVLYLFTRGPTGSWGIAIAITWK